jgi:inhibitor of cysteine peptidase
MKKMLLGLAFMVLLVSLLAIGCSSSVTANTDPDKTIHVKVGEEFIIELKSNPTTGYDWEYTSVYEWIQLMDKNYEADTPVLTGSGGTDIFTFKAHGEGTATLDFVYKRSWETTSAEQKTFTVEVSR